MTNITQFIEFQNKRSLMAESYYELVEFMTLPSVCEKIVRMVAFILFGWLISFAAANLTCYYLPLTTRRPNKDIFFAVYKEKIRNTFHHQTEETHQTIVMGINRVLKSNYEGSTVFLMMVPQGAMPTAKRLVTLLVHCILVAYQLPASQRHVNYVITDGIHFTSHDDEWPLFYQVRRHLRHHGVAAIMSFECLHPQVVRTLQLLVPHTFSLNKESVLILVVDLRNRFTEYQKKNLSANSLGKTFLEELFLPYFDQSELGETINRLGYRCFLVNPEPDNTNFIQ